MFGYYFFGFGGLGDDFEAFEVGRFEGDVVVIGGVACLDLRDGRNKQKKGEKEKENEREKYFVAASSSATLALQKENFKKKDKRSPPNGNAIQLLEEKQKEKGTRKNLPSRPGTK